MTNQKDQSEAIFSYVITAIFFAIYGIIRFGFWGVLLGAAAAIIVAACYSHSDDDCHEKTSDHLQDP